MKDSLRHFVAEFVGTFALVFVGGASIIAAQATRMESGLIAVAFAHGVILAVCVSALMRISGHFNPAVTIGFLAARRIEAMMAGVYIAAQIIGAILAAYALKMLLPETLAMAARLGGQSVALETSAGQAIALEAIAAFFLTFVIFGTAVDPKAPKIGGLAIGLTLTACILAIGPFTGGSLNPARSFGPAVASGIFEGQAVYWIGPIVGAVAAALLYEMLFIRSPREREPVDHGAVRP
ncbi:MAG TPA: aquaporin [Gemmatimonadaceae bacterium]|jgi:MIP family channel proteins|nr:aquaporin [Gemmatimonadaceae bacterium]